MKCSVGSLAHSRPLSGSHCVFLQDGAATNLLLCLPPAPWELHTSSVTGDELTSYPDDCVSWLRTVGTQSTLGREHNDREPPAHPRRVAVVCTHSFGRHGSSLASASQPVWAQMLSLGCSSFLGSQAHCVIFKATIPRAVTSLLFHFWAFLFFKQTFVRLIFLSLEEKWDEFMTSVTLRIAWLWDYIQNPLMALWCQVQNEAFPESL